MEGNKPRSTAALTMLLPVMIMLPFAASFVIWHQKGFVGFVDYHKDLAINIYVATLTCYLLYAERKGKQAGRALAAQQKRMEDMEVLLEKGVPDAIKEYKKTKQRYRSIDEELRVTEKTKGLITTALAVLTIISALLATIGHLIVEH